VDFLAVSFPKSSADTHTARQLLRAGLVQKVDLIVRTIGEPIGKAGGTNTMKISRGENRRA
jgi:pyruvate kinase